MTTTTEVVTEDQAAGMKARLGAQQKTWHSSVFANAAAFVSFINVNPAQGAGEAFCTDRSDGQIDGFYYL